MSVMSSSWPGLGVVEAARMAALLLLGVEV